MTQEQARDLFNREFELRRIATQHWPVKELQDLIADLLVQAVVAERVRCKKVVLDAVDVIGRE